MTNAYSIEVQDLVKVFQRRGAETRAVDGISFKVKRGEILKGEAGIGPKTRKDPTFEKFLTWVDSNKKPRTARGYRNALKHLARSFGARRLSQIDELSVERHKRALVEAGHGTAANRQLAILRSLFNRCRDDLRLYDGGSHPG